MQICVLQSIMIFHLPSHPSFVFFSFLLLPQEGKNKKNWMEIDVEIGFEEFCFQFSSDYVFLILFSFSCSYDNTSQVGGVERKLLLLLCITIIKLLKLIGIFQMESKLFHVAVGNINLSLTRIFHSSLSDNTIEKN